jgi:TPR repeat protein
MSYVLVLALPALAADPARDAAVSDVLGAMTRPPAEESLLGRYMTACDAGDAAACADAGVVHEAAGRRDAAIAAHRRACAGGWWFSCNNLILLGDATGGSTLAAGHRAACAGGSAFACDQLSLYSTDAAEQDYAMGRACELGAAMACYSLALQSHEDPIAARAALARGCELGSVDACTDLEVLEEADAAADAVCTRRVPEACHAAALVLEQSRWHADEGHEPRIHALYATGCAGGHGPSCVGLGEATSRGWGGAPDERAALAAWKRGCRLGFEPACLQYGLHVEWGDGTTASPGRALGILEKSCDRGAVESCAEAASLLVSLRGDVTTAARHLVRACTERHDWACEELGDGRATYGDAPLRDACTSGASAACAALERPAR